jgi:ABC-type sugar transport system substrate-binding protein
MKPVKALVCLATHDNDYQRAQAASAESVAQKLGLQLELSFADGDAVNQVQQILTAIQRRDHGIDVVITEPVGTGMLNVAETATKMGIGWCVLNFETDYVNRLRQSAAVPVFEVSVDQVEAGRIQAQQIEALLPNGGTVLYIMGPSAGTTAARRSEGMLAQKPANIQLKTMTGSWTEESGQRVVSSWLKLSTSKSAGFSAIVSQNDAMAVGARRAFNELADSAERLKWLHLPLLGVDGLPETGQKYVQRKLLTATVVTPPVAGIALELFAKSSREGQPLPARHLVGSQSYPAIQELQPETMMR